MAKGIGKIIDVRKSVFLGGIFMLDRVRVANEIVSDMKRCHKDYLIFKVNFKIAYNSIS